MGRVALVRPRRCARLVDPRDWWGRDPGALDKFARNAQELPRYAGIEAEFARDARRMVRDFTQGEVSEPELLRRFEGRLEQATADAFVAGRRSRRDYRPDVSEGELGMLRRRVDRNMGFFRRFAQDMKAGRGRMDYGDRADLYAKSLWSVYNRGETTDWDDPGAANARYEWILEPGAEHCRDCIERTRLSRDPTHDTFCG